MCTDLHIHTVASDGCWTPERLIVELQARGIGFFAVADLRPGELEERMVRPRRALKKSPPIQGVGRVAQKSHSF